MNYYGFIILAALSISAVMLWIKFYPMMMMTTTDDDNDTNKINGTNDDKNGTMIQTVLGFDGNGYAVIPKEDFKIGSTKYSLKFDLKCNKSHFLMKVGKVGTKESPSYLLLYIALTRDGRVLYAQHSSTSNSIAIESVDSVTDDNWHTIELIRNDQVRTILVDGRISKSVVVDGPSPSEIIPDDALYLGGMETNDLYPFVGCMKNVTFNGELKTKFQTFGTVKTTC